MDQKEILDRLKKSCLTDGEARVYLALLNLGESTTGPIIDESHISSSKVYAILDRLEKKGLASHLIKNGRKVFSTTSPSHLEKYIELQDIELHDSWTGIKEILPNLIGIRQSAGPLQEATIVEGTKAIKVGINKTLEELEPGDEFYIMGVPKEAAEMLLFFEDWHKRRVKKFIKCKMLYNLAAKDLGEKRKKLPLTQIRYLPENIVTPALIDVVPKLETTAIMLFGLRPLYISIKNKKIAESFLSYFNLLWQIAKP